MKPFDYLEKGGGKHEAKFEHYVGPSAETGEPHGFQDEPDTPSQTYEGRPHSEHEKGEED